MAMTGRNTANTNQVGRLTTLAIEQVGSGGSLSKGESVRIRDHTQDVIDRFILESGRERASLKAFMGQLDLHIE